MESIKYNWGKRTEIPIMMTEINGWHFVDIFLIFTVALTNLAQI